jgi:hypothetical protein
MVTREDLESFFIRMDADYEEVDEGMFLLRGRHSGAPMVVHHADALLLIRMKLMDLPETPGGNAEALYRALLELETLDFHELQASVESIELAASGHMKKIRALAGEEAEG